MIRFRMLFVVLILASTLDAQPTARAPFSIKGRFDAGDAANSVRFVFSVEPTPPKAPLVHLLPQTPHGERVMVPISNDQASGLYTASFTIAPEVGEGSLVVELVDDSGRLLDLHGVAIAAREHATSGPMSRSAVDGNFAVFTTPQGLPPKAQILIAALELPLSPLPAGVEASVVLSVHSVTLVGGGDAAPAEWSVVVRDARTNASPSSLLFLPSGGREWTNLGGTRIRERPLVAAKFAGPGTYVLLNRVWP